MITKLTIQPPTLSYTHDADRDSRKLKAASVEVCKMGKQLQTAGNLIGYLTQFPDEPLLQSINLFSEVTPSIKEYTKKKRTYSIPYLTIWEEDK